MFLNSPHHPGCETTAECIISEAAGETLDSEVNIRQSEVLACYSNALSNRLAAAIVKNPISVQFNLGKIQVNLILLH